MEVDDVDVVRAHSLKRIVNTGDDRLVCQVGNAGNAVTDLRREDEFGPAFGQVPADSFFGETVRAGRVYQRHAEVERPDKQAFRLSFAHLMPAEPTGPETDGGDFQSGISE